MKMTMKPINSPGCILLMYLFLAGCTEHQIAPDTDYFPLTEEKQWNYQRWFSNNTENPLETPLDTLSLHVKGDTLIEDQSYKQIVNRWGVLEKVVRKEGSKYYGRNHELYGGFSHEYVFLDTDKQPGESWTYFKYDSAFRTDYVILSKNATHTILGKTYHDVIEVEVNYYQKDDTGEYQKWVTALHYYANGEGEIYHYYPYPVSLFYANVTAFKIPLPMQ